MKKVLLLLFAVFVFLTIRSQPQGKPITEIFADFRYYMNDTLSSTSNGFGLNRAYLGYTFQPAGNISGTVILNVCNPADLAPGSKERRYAFFREASVSWANEKLSMSFGMTSTRALIYQQRFYGKRYVAENFEAMDGYSTVADLGFSADYIINSDLKIDITLMNGEGYNNLHTDNSIKTSLGIYITPTDKGHIRLYADFDRPAGVWQQLYIGFVGYEGDILKLGAELAFKTNPDGFSGHNSWGFSTTCSVETSEKSEVFGRYDFTASNTLPEDQLPWNHLSDRQFFIAGFQYTFNEFWRVAIDYQGYYPRMHRYETTHGLFINTHFKF